MQQTLMVILSETIDKPRRQFCSDLQELVIENHPTETSVKYRLIIWLSPDPKVSLLR